MGRLYINGGPFGGFGLGRLILMIVFLLFIAAISYVVIRHFDRAHHHAYVAPPTGASSSNSAAADVLKMRFAKGEIDEDEFTLRMNVLKDHQSVS